MSRKQKEYKYHYTYRITNKIENKHYYGVRSCNCLPKEDIGFKYFSTSKNKAFKDDIKENPQNYKYKVVKIFGARKEALAHEIFLHSKFEVGKNPKFYNGAKQTSTGFDRSGAKLSSETKILLSNKHTGKILSEEHKNNIGKSCSGELNGMYGKQQSEQTKSKISRALKGKAAWNKGLKLPQYSHIKRNLKEVECPYCGKIGKGGNMTRYHFDNCKNKEKGETKWLE